MTPEEKWEVKFVNHWETGTPAWQKRVLAKIKADKL